MMIEHVFEVNKLFVKSDGRSFWFWIEENRRVAKTFLAPSDVEDLCMVLITEVIKIWEEDAEELRRRAKELEAEIEKCRKRNEDVSKEVQKLNYLNEKINDLENKIKALREALLKLTA